MKILSVRHAIPSRVVTNDDVVDRIVRASNRGASEAQAAWLDGRIRAFFDRTGTVTRYHLADGETAMGILRGAIDRALDAANVRAGELDFIIFAGVSRGWLEPSMAALVQREISAAKASCFDILEACASWLRAMQVGHALCRSGTYRLGMIVNCECGMVVDQGRWDVGYNESLERWLAAGTIGEAATATIVAAEKDSDFYAKLRSFGEHGDLCMIPLASAGLFLDTFDGERDVPGKFFSDTGSLFKHTIKALADTYESDPVLPGREHDLIFSHAATARAGAFVGRKYGFPEQRWYCTHARFGNTVAASVPLGMSCALDDGVLDRGARILAIVGSAGISAGFLSMTF